jgi:phage terminase small subunit
MRVERFMNTVRRVTVENGQIVVIMKDGKVTRHPMANVTRMAIEP